MLRSSGFSVRILDLYFDESAPRAAVDIVRCNQFSRPVPHSNCVPFSTMLIDVSRTPDELFAEIHPDCRYKIKRASERDCFSYHFWTGPEAPHIIDQFTDFYNYHAALKGLANVSRPRLEVMANGGVLDVSLVKSGSGEILCATSHLLTSSRLRTLHVASSFRTHAESSQRNLMGRAHRYMIWQNIVRAGQSGVKFFDFGGWYTGTSDPEKLRINEFKRGFGGEIYTEFNCALALTWRGRVALAAAARRLDLVNLPPMKA